MRMVYRSTRGTPGNPGTVTALSAVDTPLVRQVARSGMWSKRIHLENSVLLL